MNPDIPVSLEHLYLSFLSLQFSAISSAMAFISAVQEPLTVQVDQAHGAGSSATPETSASPSSSASLSTSTPSIDQSIPSIALRTKLIPGIKLEVKYKALKYVPEPLSALKNNTTRTRRGYLHQKCRLSENFDDEDRSQSLYLNFNKAMATGFVPEELKPYLLVHPNTTAEKRAPVTNTRYTLTVRPSVRAPGKYEYLVKGYQRPMPEFEIFPEAIKPEHQPWYLVPHGPAGLYIGSNALGSVYQFRGLTTKHTPALPKSPPPSKVALLDQYAQWADKILKQLILVMAMDRSTVLKLRAEQQMLECVLGYDNYNKANAAELAKYKSNLRFGAALVEARKRLAVTGSGGEMAENEMASTMIASQDQEEQGDSGFESWVWPSSGTSSTPATSTGTTSGTSSPAVCPPGATSGTGEAVQEKRASRATRGKLPARYRDD